MPTPPRTAHAPPPPQITNCSLIAIDLASGDNTTLGDASAACDGLTQTWPAFSVASGGALLVAVASAPAIVSIDTATLKTTVVAPLPPYDSSDPFLGFVGIAGTTPSDPLSLWLVTQKGVWSVADGAVTRVATVKLPATGKVAGSPTGGMGGAPLLFVTDAGSATLYVIDMGAEGSTTTVSTGISKPMDLQWSESRGELLILGSYTLYTVDYLTGRAKKLASIPNGPGFPSVNAINSPTGTIFAYMDFAHVNWVDTATGKITQAETGFVGAPRVVGYPSWYPSAAA